MDTIGIYTSSAPGTVSKLEAARLLAETDGPSVRICDVDDTGRLLESVDMYGRRKMFGATEEPTVNWSAIGSVDAARARRYAEMITLAAEVADLAAMLAAE